MGGMMTRPHKPTRMLGVLFAFALLVSACGGDSEDAGSAPETAQSDGDQGASGTTISVP